MVIDVEKSSMKISIVISDLWNNYLWNNYCEIIIWNYLKGENYICIYQYNIMIIMDVELFISKLKLDTVIIIWMFSSVFPAIRIIS